MLCRRDPGMSRRFDRFFLIILSPSTVLHMIAAGLARRAAPAHAYGSSHPRGRLRPRQRPATTTMQLRKCTRSPRPILTRSRCSRWRGASELTCRSRHSSHRTSGVSAIGFVLNTLLYSTVLLLDFSDVRTLMESKCCPNLVQIVVYVFSIHRHSRAAAATWRHGSSVG